MDHDKKSMENPYSSINKSMQYPSLVLEQELQNLKKSKSKNSTVSLTSWKALKLQSL